MSWPCIAALEDRLLPSSPSTVQPTPSLRPAIPEAVAPDLQAWQSMGLIPFGSPPTIPLPALTPGPAAEAESVLSASTCTTPMGPSTLIRWASPPPPQAMFGSQQLEHQSSNSSAP